MVAEGWCAISWYCKCGAKLHVSGPVYVVAEAKRLFWKQHDGPGHGSCDPQICNSARLKAEAQTLLEMK